MCATPTRLICRLRHTGRSGGHTRGCPVGPPERGGQRRGGRAFGVQAQGVPEVRGSFEELDRVDLPRVLARVAQDVQPVAERTQHVSGALARVA